MKCSTPHRFDCFSTTFTLVLIAALLASCSAPQRVVTEVSVTRVPGSNSLVVTPASAGAPPENRPPNRAAQRLIDKGVRRAIRGHPEAAIPYYTKAIEADPDNLTVRSYRLNACRGLGQTDLALQDCEAMIRSAPDATMGYFNRGLVLADLNRLDEALADFDRVAAMNPNTPWLRSQTMQIHARKGDYDKAIGEINLLIQETPPPATHLIFQRGQFHLGKRDFSSALADFDTVIRDDKNLFVAHYWRGKALDESGRAAEAIEAYKDFHNRLSDARRRGSKTAQNLRTFTMNTLIGAVMLAPWFGLASVMDDPARGFTHSYDAMDAEAVKRIAELSGSSR